MASKKYQPLFQCVACELRLNETSKTLPCLHSLCNSCFRNTLEDEATEGKCPQCGDGFHIYKSLTLSPILANELKRQRLSRWQCDTCTGENDLAAEFWCIQCQKLFCNNCMRFHNKLHKEHISKKVAEMKRVDAIEMMMGEECLLHGKAMELFCNNCNMCYCNTCYKSHSTDYNNSNCMNVPPSLVKEKTLKMKTQIPHLEKEMNEFKEFLQSSNENLFKYTDDSNLECESKCQDVWIKYEQIVENARLDALDLCQKIRQETAEVKKRWQNSLDKNTRILKEVEIWLLNLQHLLREDHQDREVLCGLKLLTSRLPSRHLETMRPNKTCELCFTLPDWWHQGMEPSVSRQIPSVSCVQKTIPVKKLVKENQWILPGSKSREIRTILIHSKDRHIFLCDYKNESIIEMSEIGQFVSEFFLSDEQNQNFTPVDMCSISSEEFVVCGVKKLIFLKRIENDPFLQIQKIVPTTTEFYSVCVKNETIFTCDFDFGIHRFTKEGKEIQTITNERLGESKYCPRIRVDFSSGKFWGSSSDRSDMFCFNLEGEKIDSFKKEKKLFDFSLTEFGQFYCNLDGIFSFSPQKLLHGFEKRLESYYPPVFFVFQNKMFVCFENDNEWKIEIFKIFY